MESLGTRRNVKVKKNFTYDATYNLDHNFDGFRQL